MLNSRTTLTPALLLAMALLLGACSSSEPADPAAPVESGSTEAPDEAGGITLDGSDWRAAGINGAVPVSAQPTTVGFDGTDISGFDGCNEFNGTYEQAGNQLEVTGPGLAGTLMSCEDEVADQAATFTQILTGPATLVQTAEGELTVNSDAGTLVLQLED